MSERDERLATSRTRFESRWLDTRSSLHREVGFAPRQPGWLLLLLAVAAGFSLALAAPRRLGGANADPADDSMPYDFEI